MTWHLPGFARQRPLSGHDRADQRGRARLAGAFLEPCLGVLRLPMVWPQLLSLAGQYRLVFHASCGHITLASEDVSKEASA